MGKTAGPFALFSDLMAALGRGGFEQGVEAALRVVLRTTGAGAGLLQFRPGQGPEAVVTVVPDGDEATAASLRRLPSPRRARVVIARGPAGRGPRGLSGTPWRSLTVIPLVAGGQRVGQLALLGTRAPAPAFRGPDLLVSVGTFLGTALLRLRELSRRAEELEALSESGTLLTSTLDLPAVLQRITRSATALIGASGCGVLLRREEDPELLDHAAGYGFRSEIWQGVTLRVGEGIIGRCARDAQPILVEDALTDSDSARRDVDLAEGIRAMLCVPLRTRGEVMGVLAAFAHRPGVFTDHHRALLEGFAVHAALAISHARLFDALRAATGRLELAVQERTRALEAETRFAEVVLETLPMGLYVLDRELRVVRTNARGARTLPCPEEVGCPFLPIVPAERQADFQRFLDEVWRSGRVQQVEMGLTAEGESRMLRLAAAPLGPPGGAATHAVLLIEDVTLRRRLEQQILLTEKLATAGRLAAGVAHELNNPLATIAGCAEALLERSRDDALKRLPAFQDFPGYLTMIEEEAYRCKEITESLLQFVREPGTRRARVELGPLIERTIELIRHQARFEARRVVTELAGDLPPVLANDGQLRQVFLTLLVNGLEAMPQGGTLTVRAGRLGEGEVFAEVADEGPGIPEADLPRIFEPFFTTKPPGQGTGLGLPIAQGIVADHGGRIEVRSRVGEGSSFRVILAVGEEAVP